MKKKLLLSVIQLVCTTLYSLSDCECRIDQLEEQVEQLRIVSPNETCGANTALARPILDVECGCCGSNFFAEASILYWYPKVAGTEFAFGSLFVNEIIDEDEVVTERFGSLRKAYLKSIDFEWNWGFKVGLGYNFPYDGWDIFLEYTRFTAQGRESICTGKENEYLIPCKLMALVQFNKHENIQLVNKKSYSRFCMTLDALELKLGRSFYVSEYLALCPKIGVKVSWIALRQHTRYNSANSLTTLLTGLSTPFDYTMKDCNQFTGTGPYLGLRTEWHFCGNFYFYGDLCGSWIYGLFNTHHRDKANYKEENTETTNPFGDEVTKTKNCICQMRHAFSPTMGAQFGLAYSTYCNCDKMHIALRLGFDAQYIWRINQIIETRDTLYSYRRISEDLSIHGVTFDIRFDF